MSALSGLALLALFAVLTGERLPSPTGLVWSVLAGVAGAVGIASLYRGLSLWRAAAVAPTSAVIGAALPVAFSALTQGPPGLLRLLGFGLALLGIWFVSLPDVEDSRISREGFLLACLAGTGFGAFFILIAQADRELVFTPLVVERACTSLIALLLLQVRRRPFSALRHNPTAWLAGLLDAGGNIFYLLARQYTRLDIAAVLSSLYPASTVILASLILKEKVTLKQWVGVTLCLTAIVLITI